VSTTNRRPLFRSPPHLVDASGNVAIWITRPAGMVVQLLHESVATSEMARFISRDGYAKLLGALAPNERAYFLYDMALMERYESEARMILTQWGIDVHSRIKHIAVRPPPEMNKLGRMGIQTIAAAMSLVGVPFNVVDDLEPFIREQNLRPRI
jgi:hypothetical protein